MGNRTVTQFATLKEACQEAARVILTEARRNIAARDKFSFVLAGGNTPAPLYRLLAGPGYREIMPWGKTHIFWGDERCVPPDDPASNFGMSENTMLADLVIPSGNIHRMAAEFSEPREAALAYETELHEFFNQHPTGSFDPRFDLILLGMGSDGHTASLFPNHPALDETDRWVAQVDSPLADPPVPRLTLTLPLINRARLVLFLVSGPSKMAIVEQILADPKKSKTLYPAARVRPAGKLSWFLAET